MSEKMLFMTLMDELEEDLICYVFPIDFWQRRGKNLLSVLIGTCIDQDVEVFHLYLQLRGSANQLSPYGYSRPKADWAANLPDMNLCHCMTVLLCTDVLISRLSPPKGFEGNPTKLAGLPWQINIS